MRSLIRPTRVPSDIDFLFGSFFDDAFRAAPRVAGLRFPIDVHESDDRLTLTAELPGVRADDLEITVKGNRFTLSGEKKPVAVAEADCADGACEAPAQKQRKLSERVFGSFRRELELPFTVDAASVEARFEDGVLTVTLPKADSERPLRIEVRKG